MYSILVLVLYDEWGGENDDNDDASAGHGRSLSLAFGLCYERCPYDRLSLDYYCKV